MSTIKILATETPAEEWGRLAVSLPGWRWMPGMLVMSDPAKVPRPVQMAAAPEYTLRARVFSAPLGLWYGVGVFGLEQPDWEGEICSGDDLPGTLPDPDDPATAGCLLVLAGAPHRLLPTVEAWLSGAHVEGMTLGRACIADVRDQWGRWPGGEE